MGEVFAQHKRIVNVNKLEMEGKLVYLFLVWFGLVYLIEITLQRHSG